jgi:hypothetical protein
MYRQETHADKQLSAPVVVTMKTEPKISKPIPLRCPNPADLGAQPAWTDATQVEAENVKKTKSALGFIRAPARPKSQDATEERFQRYDGGGLNKHAHIRF